MAPEMRKPFLVGKKIYLRPLEPEDVTEEYLHWLNNETISGIIQAATMPSTREKVLEFVESATRRSDTIFLAIIEKETGTHVGNIKLGPISWIDRRAEYGRLIGTTATRSRGYGSEAAALIIRYAFQTLNLHKVYAKCLASNKIAIHSNEKNGLSVEATLKEYQYANGAYQDVAVMGITRQQWLAARSED